jgi:TP901 family phage tail tape measure protein
MTKEFGAVQTQVAALNTQLATMVNQFKSVDPSGFRNMSKAASQNSRVFRDAMASTGAFEVQQVRLNSATDEYVKKLKQQKLSFRDMWRDRRAVSKAAYKEQLGMEKMMVRRNPAGSMGGKEVFDVAYPRAYADEVNNAANRMAFFAEELRSGSTQMVNWGKNTQWAGRQLTVGLTMPIAMAGAAAAKMAYDMDKSLTRIQKVYDTTADSVSNSHSDMIAVEKELQEVRKQSVDTALMAAKEYGSAAVDTLDAQAELAASGLAGVELQKATAEVMRISTLGDVEYQDSIRATISLNGIFKMSNQELAESFNYMNAVENATSLQTQDFIEAIPIAASAVQAFGGDVRELGVLLTAMKERGIEANQAATAIKATMQRLGRPSKQIREEWQALTGTDITKLVDGSDGLIEVFTNINNATKGLDPDAQRKAFAGLFGSYQVTKMMALTKGMGDLEAGVGQVSEAARLAGTDVSELAKTAEGELGRMQESVSLKFKSAWEQLRIQLGQMGEPFLKIGTLIMDKLTGVLKFFDKLPDGVKKIAGIAIALGALAGPALMLVGLFGNLFGNAMKGVGNLLALMAKLQGAMQINTKESRIAAAAAKFQEQGYISQAKAVQTLTASLETYAKAQQVANTLTAQGMGVTVGANGVIGPTGTPPVYSEAAKAQFEKEKQEAIIRQQMSQYATGEYTEKRGHYNRYKINNTYKNEEDVRAQAIKDIAENEKAAAAAAAVGAKNTEKMKINLNGAALASAAMTAGMAGTMVFSDGIANDISQYLVIGSMVVPAVTSLLGLLKDVKIQTLVITASEKVRESIARRRLALETLSAAAGKRAAAWSAAGAVGQGKLAVATGTAAGSMGRLVTFAGALMGPLGWAVTAVTALGFAGYKVWKHYDNIRKEQREIDKNQGKLITQTERWASATGKALDGYKKLGVAAGTGMQTQDMTRRVEFYRSDEEKEITESFQDMDSTEKDMNLMSKFIDLVEGANLSTAEATKEIQAFLVASGETWVSASVEAERMANIWRDAYGNGMDASEFGEAFGTVANQIFNKGWGDNNEQVKSWGLQAGEMWAQGFRMGNKSERANLENDLRERVLGPWEELADKVESTGMGRNLKIAFSLSDEDLNEMLSNGEEMRKFYMQLDAEGRKIFRSHSGFASMVEEADELERTIIGPIAESLGVAANDVDTLGELFHDAAIQAATLGDRIGGELTSKLKVAQSEIGALFEETTGQEWTGSLSQQKMLDDLIGQYQELEQMDPEDMTDEQREAFERLKTTLAPLIALTKIYAITLGIDLGTSDVEALANLMNGVKGETSAADAEAEALKSTLNSIGDIKISVDLVGNMFKDVRGGIQNTMADMLTADFDSRMQASQEAVSTYWDNRKSNLDAEMDRRSKGLDAKWEKRKDAAEKYWDDRIKGIEKTIEAEEKAEEQRQKMFDAEIARIERLNGMQSNKIDFNIALNEGDFDEAARVMSNIDAEAQEFALNKASEESAERSEKRTDKLSKKQDRLEEQKDKAMEAMEKREEAEKAHLDRIADMQKASLDKQADQAIAANKADWDRQKAAFDEQMALFLSFTARNDKELKAHMDAVGIGYDEFGELLRGKGTNWATFMGSEMDKQITAAALKLRDDAAWSNLGEGAMESMIKAMGFKSHAQFQHFIKTGEMKDLLDPVKYGETSGNGAKKGKKSQSESRIDKAEGLLTETRHEGGFAGAGGGSRKGVARNLQGLHSSEMLIRAQKGEFIVNRKDAAANPGILEAINSGKMRGKPRGGPGEYPIAGLLAGTVMRSAMFGIMKNVQAKYEGAKAAQAAAAAAAAAGGAGGGNNFGAYVPGKGGWQKPSAAGYTWSNTHDYAAPKGTPVYAASDATVLRSTALSGVGTPGNGWYDFPYSSYGEYVSLRLADGNTLNYGHMMPGSRRVSAGQKIPGGTQIGNVGNTGNAWGASGGYHLHMDLGSGGENARGFLASRGIALKKGAADVRFDNTLANLHHGERVLTQDLTQKMDRGMTEYFANGGSSEYNVQVTIDGANKDVTQLANEVVRIIKRTEARKPTSRTMGNGR